MRNLINRIRKVVSRIISNQKDLWNYRILLFKPEHYPTLISQDVKERTKTFTQLKTIDKEQKSQIDLKVIRRYARRIAKLNFIEERLHFIRKTLYRFMALMFILFLGRIYYLPSTIATPNYITEYLPVIASLLLYNVLFHFAQRMWSLKFHFLFIVGVLAGGLIYLSNLSTGYRIYAFGLAGLQIILLVFIGIDYLISEWANRQINNKFPETIIVNNILIVMKKLDEGMLSNFYLKTMFVKRLEYAALYLEKYIYEHLKTTDELTNEWIKERTHQIASAIRDKKKWVYTPRPDTSLYLMRSLADFLIHFLRNEWDFLERVDMPKVAQRGIWKAQALALVRNLIFGLLPISTLLLLQYTKIVSKPFSDSIIGIATIWAIVNLLWLDPAIKDKLGAVKDVTGLVSPKN